MQAKVAAKALKSAKPAKASKTADAPKAAKVAKPAKTAVKAPAKAAKVAKPGKGDTVTLRHLGTAISEAHSLPKKQANEILADAIGMIAGHLKKGARIHVIGKLTESKWIVTATKEERRALYLNADHLFLSLTRMAEARFKPRREAAEGEA